MSVLEKIKTAAVDVGELTKEESTLTIESDCRAVIENYELLKLFSDERLLVKLRKYNVLIEGASLVIEVFSPSRIAVTGKIKNVSYMSFEESIKEEV